MEIGRIDSQNISIIKPETTIKQEPKIKEEVKAETGFETRDEVAIRSEYPRRMIDLVKPGVTEKGETKKSIYAVSLPPENTEPARNNAPIVVVHGTGEDSKSISDYEKAALETGHPVDINTYLTIKNGDRMEKSAAIVAGDINKSRLEITSNNLAELSTIKDNPDKLKEFFSMDSKLYGGEDPSVEKMTKLLPDVIDRIQEAVSLSGPDSVGTFSGRLKRIESNLAGQIKDTGFAGDIADDKKRNEVCGKAAIEIIESVAPRSVVVGHSMGGFVSYMVAVNPEGDSLNEGPLKYDAGNGISTAIILSSPIGKGLRKPLPRGLENYAFEVMEKNFLHPMEGTPGMQLAQMNPLFTAWYMMSKSAAKESMKAMSNFTTAMSNPLTYSKSPGYKQIAEGSDFFRENIQGRKVPDNMTVISVTSKMDGISEADRSKVDDSQTNAFNLDVDVKLSEEFLKKPNTTPSILAHYTMARYPFERGSEFRKEIYENPAQIPKLLNRRNHDGVRYGCLKVLLEDAKSNPGFFSGPEGKKLLDSIRDVAGEKLPFTDSPSCLAHQILEVVA